MEHIKVEPEVMTGLNAGVARIHERLGKVGETLGAAAGAKHYAPPLFKFGEPVAVLSSGLESLKNATEELEKMATAAKDAKETQEKGIVELKKQIETLTKEKGDAEAELDKLTTRFEKHLKGEIEPCGACSATMKIGDKPCAACAESEGWVPVQV